MTMRRAGFWLAVAIALVWTLLPIYWFTRLSMLTPAEIATFPPAFLPDRLQPGAFLNIFGWPYTTADGILLEASGQSSQVIRGFLNSLVVSLAVTVISLLVVVPLAYVFARLEFPHRGKLLFAILLAVAMPPVSTLIPFYALYIQLGLAGTRFGLIIVTLTITIPFVTWMLIGYFRRLPAIEGLARVDGMGRLTTFAVIFVPMARAGIAVAAVIAFLFSWNEYTYAQILVNGTPATTMPAAISGFLFQNPEPQHLSAALVVTLLPPFVVAFLLQRYIADMNLVDPVR